MTTRDIEHWHPGWIAAADASDPPSYHDWIINRLADAMRAAGQRFIDQHPDLFATGLD